jgi:hypothetical protein
VGDAGSSLSGDGADIVGCQSDPRVDTYSPGLTKPGQAHVFQFVLVSADPAPPAQYVNAWVLKVVDSAGNPVSGATITSVTPFMPDHGHGTSTPQVVANPDGTITVSNVYLFMLGVWRTTIVAQAGSAMDSVQQSLLFVGGASVEHELTAHAAAHARVAATAAGRKKTRLTMPPFTTSEAYSPGPSLP